MGYEAGRDSNLENDGYPMRDRRSPSSQESNEINTSNVKTTLVYIPARPIAFIESNPLEKLKGAIGDPLALKAISGVWRSARMKGLLGLARTVLEGLSRARPIAVQLSHRSEVLDVGSEETG